MCPKIGMDIVSELAAIAVWYVPIVILSVCSIPHVGLIIVFIRRSATCVVGLWF